MCIHVIIHPSPASFLAALKDLVELVQVGNLHNAFVCRKAGGRREHVPEGRVHHVLDGPRARRRPVLPRAVVAFTRKHMVELANKKGWLK